MIGIEASENINPEIEELIRESERLRIINVLANGKSGYMDNCIIKAICGYEVDE